MNTSRLPTLDIAILSAGASKRLGQPKQLVELNGQSLLVRAIDTARTFAAQVGSDRSPFVISGAYLQEDCNALHAASQSNCVQHHLNHRWHAGLSTSVALARALSKSDGLLVLLVDQYRVDAQDLRRLFGTWSQNPRQPAAASFNDTLGPPVIWPRQLTLSGRPDKTALLALNPASTRLEHAAFDLDTERDLDAAKAYADPLD